MKIKPIPISASAKRPVRTISSKQSVASYTRKLAVRRIGSQKNAIRIEKITNEVYASQMRTAMAGAIQGRSLDEQSRMLDTMFITVGNAGKMTGKQNRGFAVHERAYRILSGALKLVMKRGGEVVVKTAKAVIDEALTQLSIWLGKIVQLLINLVVNVVAEIIKYLLFGLIGGPWATIIPTILNILGPVIAVLAPVVQNAWKVGINAVGKVVDVVGVVLSRFNESELKQRVIEGIAWLYKWLRNLGKPIEDSVNAYFLRIINKL